MDRNVTQSNKDKKTNRQKYNKSFKDRKTKLLERATDIERQIDKNVRNRC